MTKKQLKQGNLIVGRSIIVGLIIGVLIGLKVALELGFSQDFIDNILLCLQIFQFFAFGGLIGTLVGCFIAAFSIKDKT